MSVETIEREPEVVEAEAPPAFGRCPVCGKVLRPRCKVTGEPRNPPVGAGFDSRAKCDGCGAILVYLGNAEWRVAVASDLEDEGLLGKLGY